ncbi:MAG: phosphate--AMP phosphotransferase [Candidatus Nealsonbacteria bacterium]|nr:phosphate--AMP phosphotransferase [Candidatus Nealsonbacteria bacterium]
MLELVDLDNEIPKETYRQVFPELEARLGECQRAARAAGVPVVIIFEGWDAAGKGTIINRLTQALDPRGFKVLPISAPTEDEGHHPWMRRFWNALPAAGSFAIFDRSWYGRVLVERMEKQVRKQQWKRAYEDVEQLERQLADDGAVIVKFWLHIGKKEQKRRFKKLENNPATAWKVSKREWKNHRKYEQWQEAVEEMLERTGTAYAPWTVVEATQGRYARVKVFETIVQTVESELERRAATPKIEPQPMPAPEESATRQQTILDRVDLSLSLERDEYDRELDDLQARLFHLEHELFVARVPAAIVYQGWDAAGKGGNIKRLTRGLDPRGYEVVPVAAPTAEERAHHYLWRFWKNVPKAGHITIFDRSWYGRVMVERVEGFCSEDEWKRAYREINEFERQLADFGTVIVKFWLQIDQQEQLRRFEARQQTTVKQWKITDEDWRNREKWDRYEESVVDMLQQTSTTYAPWTILEANCKLHARIKALRTVAEALESALESHYSDS